MRLSCALLLCLLLSAVALPQAKKEILERGAELEFGGGEKVVTYSHVTGENRLVLLGTKTARVLDFAGAKFVESHALRVPECNEDGQRVISPDGRRVFVYGNYDSRKKEKVERPPSVWDIGARKVSQTVSADSDGVGRKITTYRFTPDERFLLVLAKPPKAKNAERRVFVWEVERGGASGVELTRRYEIKPSPKISEWGAIPDHTGKLFTIHADKNLQLYETATGEKKYELANVETPTGWINDRIFYGERFTTLTAYEASTGRELYRQKVVWDTHTEDSGYSSSDTGYTGPGLTVVDDYTRIVPHRGGKVFMTWSAKYVEVFDSSTGELLQRLVEPQVDNTGKKPKLSGKWLVSDAGWSEDGRTLYVIDDDRKKVSLWRLAGS